MACRAGPLTAWRGVLPWQVAGVCKWGALRTRPVQPELPMPPGSPGGDAFEDHGPKVAQQKAYSALV